MGNIWWLHVKMAMYMCFIILEAITTSKHNQKSLNIKKINKIEFIWIMKFQFH